MNHFVHFEVIIHDPQDKKSNTQHTNTKIKKLCSDNCLKNITYSTLWHSSSPIDLFSLNIMLSLSAWSQGNLAFVSHKLWVHMHVSKMKCKRNSSLQKNHIAYIGGNKTLNSYMPERQFMCILYWGSYHRTLRKRSSMHLTHKMNYFPSLGRPTLS